MTKKKCCVPGCRNVFRARMSFFRFPVETGRCHKWLKFCGLQEKIRTAQDVTANMCVCQNHFLETDYYTSGLRVRLTSSAVPSIHSNGMVEPTSVSRPTYTTRLMGNKMAESLLEPFSDSRMSRTIFEDEVENKISVNAEKSMKTYSRSPRIRLRKNESDSLQNETVSSTVELTTDSSILKSQLDIDLPPGIKEETEISLEIPMKEEMLSDDEMNCDSVGEEQLNPYEEVQPPDLLLTPKLEISDLPDEEEEIQPPLAVFIPFSEHKEKLTTNEKDPFALIGIAESSETASTNSISTGGCVNPSGSKRPCSRFSNEEEQQVSAKFCFLLGYSPAKAFKKLRIAFADDVVSETHVNLWFNLFKKGQL